MLKLSVVLQDKKTRRYVGV